MQDNNDTYGLLQWFCVREPNAKTAVEALQKGYSEWGFKTWNDLRDERETIIDNKTEKLLNPRQIDDSAHIRIFNSIGAGNVLWQGSLSLEFNRRQRSFPFNPEYSQQEIFGMWVHGFQSTLDPDEWAIMFFQRLPAIMTRNGREVHGALEPYFETGTEGVIWALAEYGKDGYDGLNIIKNGDNLRVYENVTDGSVDWEGELRFRHYESPRDFYADTNDTPGERLARCPENPEFKRLKSFCYQNRPFALSLS